MSSVSYNYDVGDTVYYISSSSLKTGVVLKVSISVTSSGTTINYVLRVGSNSQTVEESILYGNCKAEGGYQDAVFTAALSTSTVVFPAGSAYSGATLIGSVVIDSGAPIALSYTVPGSPTLAVTVQDILNNLNASLTPYADATIYQNKIRIRSRSTGASSTVNIVDGYGSPLGSPTPGSPSSNKYFDSMLKFTGLSSSVDGVGDGALEALSSTVC